MTRFKRYTTNIDNIEVKPAGYNDLKQFENLKPTYFLDSQRLAKKIFAVLMDKDQTIPSIPKFIPIRIKMPKQLHL